MPATHDDLSVSSEPEGIATDRRPSGAVPPSKQSGRCAGRVPADTARTCSQGQARRTLSGERAEDAAIELKSLKSRLAPEADSRSGRRADAPDPGVGWGAVTAVRALKDTAGRVTVMLDAARMAQQTSLSPRCQYHDDSIARTTSAGAPGRDGHPARIARLPGRGPRLSPGQGTADASFGPVSTI